MPAKLGCREAAGDADEGGPQEGVMHLAPSKPAGHPKAPAEAIQMLLVWHGGGRFPARQTGLVEKEKGKKKTRRGGA